MAFAGLFPLATRNPGGAGIPAFDPFALVAAPAKRGVQGKPGVVVPPADRAGAQGGVRAYAVAAHFAMIVHGSPHWKIFYRRDNTAARDSLT